MKPEPGTGVSAETELAQLRADVARTRAASDSFLASILALRAAEALEEPPSGRAHALAQRLRAALQRSLRSAYLLATLQRPRGIRVSLLFDHDWYRRRYPDAPPLRWAAYRQYRRLSRSEGRDPNAWFDTDWYLSRYPDVSAGSLHPLDHYLEVGWREGRDPGPDFHSFAYLRAHPECVARAVNPLLHQLRTERRSAGARPRGQLGRLRDAGPPALRRIVQHYRRYGASRTYARISVEVAQLRGRRAARSVVRLVADEVMPHLVAAHLDTPRDGTTEGSAALVVSGWAYSTDGIEAIEVYVDETRLAAARFGLARPDVAAAHPRASGAEDSGFTARVGLATVPPGRHVLQVVIRDAAGHVRVLVSSFERIEPESMYHHYYQRLLPDAEETRKLQARTSSGIPAIDLVVVDGGVGELSATLRSVAGQAYPRLRCVVLTADDRAEHVRRSWQEVADRATDASLAITTDPAEALAAGAAVGAAGSPSRLVGFLEAGETLAPDALVRFVAEGWRPDIRVIYSDHDAVEVTGRHVRPWFGPDWSPDRALAQDYVGGFYLVRHDERLTDLASGILGSRSRAWRYQLLLGLTLGEASDAVGHVPQVLWSRPADGTLTASSGDELAAVRSVLARAYPEASAETAWEGESGAIRRIVWPLASTSRVSVIVPTTGRPDLVQRTLTSLTERTTYPDVEIIVLDNSRGRHPDGIAQLRRAGVTLLERDEDFNWARLSNAGAQVASGELLLFLNDDLEATRPDWLRELVRNALRPTVGAVGPLLLYPDGAIQHAGVFVVGHGGGAVHLFHGLEPEKGIYLDLDRVTREVTAVTGACLLVRRDIFEAVGGFDEDLAVVGNDVDLCLRLGRAGYRCIWTPHSRLIHHESASRSGVDHLPDEGRMWKRWSEQLLAGDPHHNPNLAQDRVDCGLEWRRTVGRRDAITRADPAAGVNLVGYLRAEMGIGEATRAEAQALTDVGLPFVVIDLQHGNPARMQDRSWLHRVAEEPHFDTNILHINADVLPAALQQLPHRLRDGRRNIGYWTWELPIFPDRWRSSFDLVDEVWVPTSFVRDAIGRDAPVPVRVVPHAVRIPRAPSREPSSRRAASDAYRFLAMYDTQSVLERKNPQAAIAAFMSAFAADDESVRLVVKVNNPGIRELQMLRRLAGGHPNIDILAEVLSRQDMDALMASCDAFVSLHRSEGFGLPIAEAMALGKPVIATGWSGNMDFMDESNAACVRYRLVALEASYGPYDKGQQWAEPDVEDAAAWMRRLRDDPDRGAAMGRRAAASILASNGSRQVGARIAEALGRSDQRSRPAA